MNSANVDEWLPLDQLEPGFDQHRLPPTNLLVGRSTTLAAADGRRWSFEFTSDTTLHWTGVDGARYQEDAYQAFRLRPDMFLVDLVSSSAELTSATVVFDLSAAGALLAVSRIATPSGASTAVSHEFVSASITATGAPSSIVEYRRSRDLVGKRVLYVYSDEHAYEHVYLNDDWYTWQCLGGPEYGQADTDACTTYQLRDDVYLFAWREKVIPCGAVVVLDFGELRSTGKLYGLAEDGRSVVNFTMGARAHHLGQVSYPTPFKPHRSF